MSAAIVCLFTLALGAPFLWRWRQTLGPCPLFALPVLAFALGFALWSLAASLGYLAGLHLGVVAAIAVGLAALSYMIPIPQRSSEARGLVPLDGLQIAALLPALILASTAAVIGPHNTLSADTVHHLIYVENFSRVPWIGYERFELSHTVPRDVLFSAYAGNAYHALIALPALLIEGGGEAAFRGLNFGAALLLASALYGLAFRLAGPERGAFAGFVAVSLAFVLFLGGSALVFGKWSPASLAYPNHMGATTALAAFLVTLSAMERESPIGLRLAAGLMIAATVALHLQWFLYIAMVVGLFALLSLAVRSDRFVLLRHNLPTAIATLIAAVLAGFPRVGPYSLNIESLSGTGTPGSLPRFVLETPLGKIVTPSFLLSAGCLVALVSAFLLIVLTRLPPARLPMEPSRRLESTLFAMTVLAFAALLVTPGLSGFLMDVASPIVVGRMTMMLQALGVIAAGVGSALIVALIPARAFELPISAVARPALIAGFTGLAAYAFLLSVWPSSPTYWQDRRARLVERGYLPLESVIDDPGVISLLKSIPDDARLLLLQPERMKEVPLIRTAARMVQPVYPFDPPSRQAEADLAPLLNGTPSKQRLATLYQRYGIDAVLAWDWPEQSTDHFARIQGFHLLEETSINRGDQAPVSLRLYEYKNDDAIR